MKNEVILAGLILAVVLVCITISPAVASTEKTMKSLVLLNKTNLSPGSPADSSLEQGISPVATPVKKSLSTTSQMKLSESGSTLFDGIQIVQNASLFRDAIQNRQQMETRFKAPDTVLPEPAPEPVRWKQWTLREYADYMATNHSNYLYYSIRQTEGISSWVSSGYLGYSPATDQIVGDKYEIYFLGPISYVQEHGIERWSNNTWRVMLMPDENEMIIQTYDETGLSPIYENSIELLDYTRWGDRYFYGFDENSNYGIISLSLFPIPSPVS